MEKFGYIFPTSGHTGSNEQIFSAQKLHKERTRLVQYDRKSE